MSDKSKRADSLIALAQAGLLHDIGKLYQRGDEPRNQQAEFLTPGSRESFIKLCPTHPQGGYPTHQHIAWSVAFCERLKVALPVRPETLLTNLKNDNFTQLIVLHHSKAITSLQELLQLADHCASGCERTPQDEQHATDAKGSRQFTKIPLVSLWSNLKGERRENWRACRITPLSSHNDNSAFPVDYKEGDNSAFPVDYKEGDHCAKAFNELSRTLDGEMETLAKNPAPTPALKLAALDDLLWRHTWCVPSSAFNDIPDIPLYCHSRAVAAIAVALGMQLMDGKGNIEKVPSKDDATPLLRFCVIDLAGIQNYIYDMNKSGFKGMAKVLRGRSFYVGAVLEAVELALLDRLGLPRVVTLMDGGGKLVLLLPERAEADCRAFAADMEDMLVEETHGALRVHIGVGEPFGVKSFFADKDPSPTLKECYDSAFADLEEQKFQPLRAFLTNGGKSFDSGRALFDEYFDPAKGACEACGKRPAKKEFETDWFCKPCAEQREIGRRLVNAKYVSYAHSGTFTMPVPGNNAICLNIHVDRELKLGDAMLSVHALDEESAIGGIPFKPLANYVPRKGSEVLDFEEIAEAGEGVAHIAAVDGDVDGLSGLFDTIWKNPKGTLARMMTASRLLNFFFGGIMEHKLQGSHIYTVYAGGDDFFYIGQWNEVLTQVGEWRKTFRDFIGDDSVTFSAGIHIAHSHEPIHRMRTAAEEQLDMAKGKGSPGRADYMESPLDDDGKPRKSRIALWGKVMRWEEDWEGFVVKEHQQLFDWLDADESRTALTNTAFYYRLLGYARLAEKIGLGDNADLRDWLWHSHLRYDLARNIRNDPEVFKHFYHFSIIDHTRSKPEPKQFATVYRVPLMWALYRNRNRQEDEKSQ